MAFWLYDESEMSKTKAAFLMTECNPKAVEFHALGSREDVAHFDGGDIRSDAGPGERYKKIAMNPEAIDGLMVDLLPDAAQPSAASNHSGPGCDGRSDSRTSRRTVLPWVL